MDYARPDTGRQLPAHVADTHDRIRVIGAHENNLQNISIDVPKRRLTVFTGVSGSGKSSLVFDTIAAESRRLINETYSAFVQGFMPSQPRPRVDMIEGLSTAIIVGQEPMGANPRSTVGTATDVDTMLRVLFSRIGTPHVGSAQALAFNVASASGAGAVTIDRGEHTTRERREFTVTGGMCPRCEGRGSVSDFDLAHLFDRDQSLNGGALLVPNYGADGWYGRIFRGSGFFDPEKPLRNFTQRELNTLLYAKPTRIKVDGINVTFEGLIPRIRKSMLNKDREAMQPHIRAFVDRAITFATCPDCQGSRLNAAARSVTIAGTNIAAASSMQITELARWVDSLDAPSAAPLLASLSATLDSFIRIGLGYLSLNRPAGSLSGGEAQRTRMIRHLGSALTDMTYIFDEPTIGLHPHDIDRMNQLLLDLRDQGNTVLVVEHKAACIAIADHVVDIGPGAGSEGGHVVFTGTVDDLRCSGTVTGNHLADRPRPKPQVRPSAESMGIRGAQRNNLRNIDLDIPLGVLCAITGVAGAGKSSLIEESMVGRDGIVIIDQAAIKGSRRSNPATYTGALEPIRKAFAKATGTKPGFFSANSTGACPSCGGAGLIYTELGFMETFSATCHECQGRRFKPEVLQYSFHGRSIADVLEMSIATAAEFFDSGPAHVPAASTVLHRLAQVGIGYLKLGQTLTSLSGGERQRLKLAAHLGSPAQMYILDEPTTGMHPADIAQLLELLDQLVDSGRSVVVVEHHPAVMAHADWLIEMGPGPGHDGGSVIFEGPPGELLASATTITGQYLAHRR